MATLLPGMRKVFGMSPVGTDIVPAAGELSCDQAAVLSRMALVPGRDYLVAGGWRKLVRVKQWLTDACLGCQDEAVISLGISAAAFKARVELGSDGQPLTRRYTMAGSTMSFDETKQMVRPNAVVKGSRAPKQKVGRDVLVVHADLEISALEVRSDNSFSEFSRCEPYISAPRILPGGSAETLVPALSKSMPFKLADEAALRQVASDFDAVVISIWGDGASKNFRTTREFTHLVDNMEDMDHVLVDELESCMHHAINVIKTTALEGKAITGLLYCASRLLKGGSTHADCCKVCEQFIAERFRWHPYSETDRPDPGAADRTRKMFVLTQDIDAPHHMRTHTAKDGSESLHPSIMLSDILRVCKLDTSADLSSDEYVDHHCDEDVDGVPCCPDEETAREKTTAAYVDLLWGRSLPNAACSRWTHILIMLRMLCMGMSCHGMLATNNYLLVASLNNLPILCVGSCSTNILLVHLNLAQILNSPFYLHFTKYSGIWICSQIKDTWTPPHRPFFAPKTCKIGSAVQRHPTNTTTIGLGLPTGCNDLRATRQMT